MSEYYRESLRIREEQLRIATDLVDFKNESLQRLNKKLDECLKQCDQYKQAYQHCVDDLIVLRANNKRLERENEKQLALLKEFRKLIDYKLTLHQGSTMYREYRSKLDQLGVK